MGQYASSNHWSGEHWTAPHLWKKNWPHPRKDSPYDPLEGFPEGRKERVMVASEEQMDLAKLEVHERGFCAHKLMDLRLCYKKNAPFYWRCKHEKHIYGECEWEDMVIRMKEWERERRMNDRMEKLEKRRLKEEAAMG